MAKYRIYQKGDEIAMHNEIYIELPISIKIGDTITYSGIHKVIDIVHHISLDIDQVMTDIHVEPINNEN